MTRLTVPDRQGRDAAELLRTHCANIETLLIEDSRLLLALPLEEVKLERLDCLELDTLAALRNPEVFRWICSQGTLEHFRCAIPVTGHSGLLELLATVPWVVQLQSLHFSLYGFGEAEEEWAGFWRAMSGHARLQSLQMKFVGCEEVRCVLRTVLPSLRRLVVAGTNIGGDLLQMAAGFPNLEELELRYTGVSAEQLSAALPGLCERLPKLRRLGVELMTDQTVETYDWGGGPAVGSCAVPVSDAEITRRWLAPLGLDLLPPQWR